MVRHEATSAAAPVQDNSASAVAKDKALIKQNQQASQSGTRELV